MERTTRNPRRHSLGVFGRWRWTGLSRWHCRELLSRANTILNFDNRNAGRKLNDLGSAPEHGTLVVTNMNDNTATVIDLASRTVRATLPTGVGPHEVAASESGQWAVVTNYGVRGKPGNTLTVIDLAKATVARTIDLGEYQRPHGVTFFAGDSLLAVTSETSKVVLLVEFATGRVVGTVPTERPASHMLALATNVGDGSVTAINPKTRATGAVTPVARLVEGIAITPDGRTAIITDPAKAEIRIIDVPSRKERLRVSVPADSILATAEFPGSPSPEGVAAGTNGFAYITLQGRNQAAGIDLSTGKIVWRLPVGAWPDGVAYARAR